MLQYIHSKEIDSDFHILKDVLRSFPTVRLSGFDISDCAALESRIIEATEQAWQRFMRCKEAEMGNSVQAQAEDETQKYSYNAEATYFLSYGGTSLEAVRFTEDLLYSLQPIFSKLGKMPSSCI